MRVSSAIFASLLTPWGPLVLGFLDASMLLFLPFAIDMLVVVLAAHNRDTFWLYPSLATAGSVAGSTVTYWIGRKIGEAGLERFVPARRLNRIRRKIRDTGALALAVPAVFPPPFPFTPLVLTCGALEMNPRIFLAAVAAMRLLRFGIEALLALVYGRHIIAWLKSDVFRTVVIGLVAVAIAGTAISAYRVIKSTRGREPAWQRASALARRFGGRPT